MKNDVLQGRPTVTCFNCEQPGHLSRDCTQTRKEAKCSYCGHFDHKGFQCKISGQAGKPKEAGLSLTRIDRLNHPVDVTIIKEYTPAEYFDPFINKGKVKEESGSEKNITILRDTGANVSLVLRDTLDWSDDSFTGERIEVRGINYVSIVPVHYAWFVSGFVNGKVKVGVSDKLAVSGVYMLLGNDLAGGRVVPDLKIAEDPVINDTFSPEISEEKKIEKSAIYPACVVTKARARSVKVAGDEREKSNDLDIDVGALFNDEESEEDVNEVENRIGCEVEMLPDFAVNTEEFIREQAWDGSLQFLWSGDEVDKIPDDYVGYYVKDGLLIRNWRLLESPADQHWMMKRQVVVPRRYRRRLMELAHESIWSGHLGVAKILSKVTSHFFWPGIKKDVAEHCISLHTCQII